MPGRLFSNQTEKEIAKLYKENRVPIIHLADKYGCSPKTISKTLCRQGIELRGNKRAVDEIDLQIAEMYENGMSLQQIADAIDRYTFAPAVAKRLEFMGIDRRGYGKYSYNHDVYDDMTREDALYAAGFTYADGCVHATRHLTQVSYGLNPKDYCILEFLKDFYETDAPIKEYGNGHCIQLNIFSQKIHAALKRMGIVVGRGHFYKTIPYIPIGLEHHFIRGYLDGDGCISVNQQVVFLGQEDILNWIQAVFHRNCGANIGKIRKRKGIHEISWGGSIQSWNIVEYIYRDATIWLERKLENTNKWKRATEW